MFNAAQTCCCGRWNPRIQDQAPQTNRPGQPRYHDGNSNLQGPTRCNGARCKTHTKTACNNVTTRVKLLTFSNYIAMYSQVRKAAFTHDGPLYRRDVEKVDRQDDNAPVVCCLLLRSDGSAHVTTLAWKMKKHVG